jgi:hypothetical protein
MLLGRYCGSTIRQSADLPCSRFGLRSRPSVAVESGEVIKRDQWVDPKVIELNGSDVLFLGWPHNLKAAGIASD